MPFSEDSKEEQPQASWELHTGKRMIDSRTMPDDLTVEEKKALGEYVLGSINPRLTEKAGFELTEDGKWFADESSHGGILLNGPDVWSKQKEGEAPGVDVFISELQDGGAHLVKFLPAEHLSSDASEKASKK